MSRNSMDLQCLEFIMRMSSEAGVTDKDIRRMLNLGDDVVKDWLDEWEGLGYIKASHLKVGRRILTAYKITIRGREFVSELRAGDTALG